MFGRFGAWEILLIVLLVVILFGHAKIPGMMKNLADGIKVFKKELKDTDTNPVGKKPVSKKVTSKNTVAGAKKAVGRNKKK